MKKVTTSIVAMVLGSLFALSAHADHALIDFQKIDGKTSHGSKDVFQSVSEPSRKGWRDHVVELNIQRSYKEKDGSTKTWNDRVSVHFTSEKTAKAFTRVMNSDKGTDLYYNFHDNSYNSKAFSTRCAIPIAGMFCRDKKDVTIVDWKNVDADELFAHAKGSSKTVPLIDYLENAENGKHALLEDAPVDHLATGAEVNESERSLSPKHDLDLDQNGKKPTHDGGAVQG